MFAVVAVVILLALNLFAGTRTVVPTTTLASETGKNTSASDTFTTQSNGNMGQANVSKEAIGSLLYPGTTTPIYAHFMPWFGGSNHMNVGYASEDPIQIKRQVDDMMSRGIGGAIIDWYGPNFWREDQTTYYMMLEAERRGGKFTFAITEDVGALNKCAATAGCDVTQQVINDLIYAYNRYQQSAAYLRIGGRPAVFFFGVETYAINWDTVRAGLPGNPLLIFRNSGAFTHSQTNGGYSWVGLSSDPNNMGLSYLDNFYSKGLTYPAMLTVGSGYAGFNDSLAAWHPNPPRILYQQCGQVWLATMAEAGKYFSSSSQLDALQIVTWNDYEEGSEIESGINNCVSVSASVSGSNLNWSISGNVNTIHHFTVFISADGANLMPLATLPATAVSYDLAGAGMAAGNYKVFVKAVGKASLTNKTSSAVTYSVTATGLAPTAKLAVSPTSGTAPLTVSASTAGSFDPDGSITSTRIEFGDGSVANAASASHTYSADGTYTARATVTDNAGLSSTTAVTVKVGGTVDFSVSATANGSTTVKAGQSANYTVVVSARPGLSFNNQVKLSCSGSPALSNCMFSPSGVTPGSGSGASNLMITTTAPVSAFLVPRSPGRPAPTYALWILLPLVGSVVVPRMDGRSRPRRAILLALLLLLLLGGLGIGCGGGGTASVAQRSSKSLGTGSGTYTVTILATSGSVQDSTTVTLTVQ